jgi:hypothetical protein
MSKKSNTLLFILGATVFNILTTIICMIILMAIYARIIPMLPESGAAWGFPVIFIAAIALSFVVYRVILKRVMKKVEMEKYFDPIFGPRRPPPRKD